MSDAMEAITARAAAQLAVREQVRGDLEALSATASVDDGRVTVRLDYTGALADLRLAPGAGRGDAARLGELITTAAADADRALCAARDELVREFTEQFDDTPDHEGTDDRSAASNL